MAGVAEIDRVLDEVTRSGGVPGVVAFAANRDGVVYQGAFGTRGVTDPAPMTPDATFWMHSMTKAVTGVAAMQCVEQGRLSLDQPAGEVIPQLATPQVLDGFDADGKPRLRAARRPITLRNLLTHTSGFVYDFWNANLLRYCQLMGLPLVRTGKLAMLDAPLAFEPGDRWEYGIGIDWAGRMVEVVTGQTLDAYLREHIFAPLGMNDTGYTPTDDQVARLAQGHRRKSDGSLEQFATLVPHEREFFPGGSGLFSTGRDYLTFLQMLLHGGRLRGATVLQPETIALMAQNHIGDLNMRVLHTQDAAMSNDVDLFPGMTKKWGLTWMINTLDVPGGRSAGSLAWAGLRNTYFWLDPNRQVAGVLLTQIFPFADPTVLGLLDQFERAVYQTLAGDSADA
jgi:CubicO group peptidase (beta-lactamase class C family)